MHRIGLTVPAALSKIHTALEGVGHVLRDRSLAVPPFQRSYSWRTEQVDAFWWDLRTAYGASNPEYFLGTIVLTSANGKHATIIDGQQRLATTAMLFAAIRDEFVTQGDVSRATVIEREYVAARELRSAELTPRIRLNAEDDQFFREWILADASERHEPAQLSASNERMRDAFLLLEERVHDHAVSAGPNWADTLIRWTDMLEHQARVITVDVADDSDAFLIFETLNDRGLALTVADLLKNYLFGLSGDDLARTQQAWMAALEALEATADEEVFTTFIRHYWSSVRGATRERELYRQLKSEIRTPASAVTFAEAINEAAPLYAASLNASHPVWAKWPGATDSAESLVRLGLEQNRPLILSAMLHIEGLEFERLLRSLVAWSVRGLIVGGIGGGTTERYLAEAATAISRGKASTAEDVLNALGSIIPSDDEFRRAFEDRRVNKARLAKYYLIALAQGEAGQEYASDVSYGVEDGFVLHQVIPRRPEAEEWPEFEPDEVRLWSLRLGNQFVVERGQVLALDAREDRIRELTEAGRPFPLTVKMWSPEQVAERQARMSRLAVDVWPRAPR